MTPTRAARSVRGAQLDFEDVQEVRHARGRRHALGGLLRLLVAAFACGKDTLRAVEDFSLDVGRLGRRALGLQGRVSDTALYELLCRLGPEGLRTALQRAVRAALQARSVGNDLFAGGAMSADGKGAASGEGPPPNAHCRSVACDAKRPRHWHLYVLRAALISSSAAPVLDQEFIGQKAWEMRTFPDLLRRVVAAFPRLFTFVCADAGMTSRANAQACLELGKHYLFALKQNQHRLYALAQAALTDAPCLASSQERAHGMTVRRELRRAALAADAARFPGVTYVLSVTSMCTPDAGPTLREERLFLTSADAALLDDTRALRLVRLHWRIENGPNWTADVVLDEDTRSVCQRASAPLVLSWLRLMAYNALACARACAALKDRLPQSWRRTQELLHQAFLFGYRPLTHERTTPVPA